MVLTLVGIFSMTAYAVTRRTQEIGIRMAFGARPSQVVGTMVRDAAWPAFFGLFVGIVGALYWTRVVASFLFETTPNDPATFAAVAVLMGVAALVAAWVPRAPRRASRSGDRAASGVAYNDRGDQIAEISEDERRECAIDDEGRMSEKPAGQGVSPSEARFRYDYDVRGNWIEKVVEGRSGAALVTTTASS
jgi:FtsX-like permease family protein